LLTAGTLHNVFRTEVLGVLRDPAGFAYAMAAFVAFAIVTWRRRGQSPTVVVDTQTPAEDLTRNGANAYLLRSGSGVTSLSEF